MKLPRRKLLHLAGSAAALLTVTRFAMAQSYPTRPVPRIIAMRASHLGVGTTSPRALDRSMAVGAPRPPFCYREPPRRGRQHRCTEAAVNASPDGHTLLLVNNANTTNATLYDKLNFNFIRDIAPIGGIVRAANVMVVNPSVPAKTVPEFIAYAKANSGKLTMASAGIGTPSHLAGELFKMMAGVDMVHVPYRSAGPALTDLARRAGAGRVPQHCRIDRVYQGWQAARARGNDGEALGGAAGHPDRG